MRFWKCLKRNNRGQSIVLFALFLPVLCGFVGLSIDVGWLMIQKNKQQDAADLAVLSGAQSLPLNIIQAHQVTSDIFEKNYGQKPAITDISFFSLNHGVKIQRNDTISFFFLPLLGIKNTTISAAAEAEVGYMQQPAYIIPFGVSHLTPMVYGMETTLWGMDNKLVGNFGLIDPTSSGNMTNPDMEKWIREDYKGESGMPKVGSTVLTKTGINEGPVSKAIEDRLAAGHKRIICAIVDYTKVNGKSEVPVLGFAMFEITSYKSKELKGKFIETIDPSGLFKVTAPYYGIRGIKLIK